MDLKHGTKFKPSQIFVFDRHMVGMVYKEPYVVRDGIIQCPLLCKALGKDDGEIREIMEDDNDSF